LILGQSFFGCGATSSFKKETETGSQLQGKFEKQSHFMLGIPKLQSKKFQLHLFPPALAIGIGFFQNSFSL